MQAAAAEERTRTVAADLQRLQQRLSESDRASEAARARDTQRESDLREARRVADVAREEAERERKRMAAAALAHHEELLALQVRTCMRGRCVCVCVGWRVYPRAPDMHRTYPPGPPPPPFHGQETHQAELRDAQRRQSQEVALLAEHQAAGQDKLAHRCAALQVGPFLGPMYALY